MNVTLVPLLEQEKETFIRNIQTAFQKTAAEQFGPCDEETIPNRVKLIKRISPAEMVSFGLRNG